MSQISIHAFIGGVKAICNRKPKYKVGHDGSTKYCDEVGLIRGGLLRSGATKVINMKESNQCARLVLQKVKLIDTLSVGDIVLRTCSIDDSFMPLPAKYRLGGSVFNGDLNNYCDIGVVVRVSPLEIVHMTKKGIKKDKNPSKWDYKGWLPYVSEGKRMSNTKSNANVSMCNAKIKADSPVRIYSEPSFSCKEFFEAENGAELEIIDYNGTWAHSTSGYVLTKFVCFGEEKKKEPLLTSDDIAELKKAYEKIGQILAKVDCGEKRKKRFWR